MCCLLHSNHILQLLKQVCCPIQLFCWLVKKKSFVFFFHQPLTPTNAKPDLAKMRIINESELRIGTMIGSGAFGSVYKVRANLPHLTLTSPFEGDRGRDSVLITICVWRDNDQAFHWIPGYLHIGRQMLRAALKMQDRPFPWHWLVWDFQEKVYLYHHHHQNLHPVVSRAATKSLHLCLSWASLVNEPQECCMTLISLSANLHHVVLDLPFYLFLSGVQRSNCSGNCP